MVAANPTPAAVCIKRFKVSLLVSAVALRVSLPQGYSASGPVTIGHIVKKQVGHLMDQLFEIELERPAPGSGEATRYLYRQLKDAIQDGRLGAGTRLPPSRQ